MGYSSKIEKKEWTFDKPSINCRKETSTIAFQRSELTAGPKTKNSQQDIITQPQTNDKFSFALIYTSIRGTKIRKMIAKNLSTVKMTWRGARGHVGLHIPRTRKGKIYYALFFTFLTKFLTPFKVLACALICK